MLERRRDWRWMGLDMEDHRETPDGAKREEAYDHHSEIGRLDKGLDAAAAYGWTVVNMKDDWNTILVFEAR
jgi:hypothetical protein